MKAQMIDIHQYEGAPAREADTKIKSCHLAVMRDTCIFIANHATLIENFVDQKPGRHYARKPQISVGASEDGAACRPAMYNYPTENVGKKSGNSS